jgi:type IV pilus assembly protein PilY1
MYTYLDATDPSDEDLIADNHQIADVDNDGILDGVTTGTADERLQRTKDLLGWPGEPVDTLTAAERAVLVIELNLHINWIRGQDVDDEDLDGNRTEDRYGFGDPLFASYGFADPLHSSPVAFTLGGDAADPVVKFVVGTNDGAIHLVNGFNGKEEFIFYPQSMLPQLVRLRSNPNGIHAYGIDGTATVWLNDVDGDGVIASEDGDFARIIIGMRRGGNKIIALDITPRDADGLDVADRSAIGSINPIYSWRITGGSAEYPRLGQTWSRPTLATVTLGNWPSTGETSAATMLLFAGGYDVAQDSGFGPGGLGNAIYMANPLTGERMLSVSTNDPIVVAERPDKVVLPAVVDPGKSTMNFPIPSDLALLDTSGDGTTDRILVGDTGGQLWRVDLTPSDPTDPTIPSNSHVRAVIGLLGTVSSDGALADQRKFFEPPDVIQVRGNLGIAVTGRFDQVNIVSGNRAHPLDRTVQDRFFAFRDLVIGKLSDDGVASASDAVPSGVRGDGIADGFTTYLGALDDPEREGDLFDVTDVVDPGATDLARWSVAKGYYLDLEDPGEKGLSSPITLEGKLFFTTYLPETVVDEDTCSLAEGDAALYGINVLDGSAIFNWDGSPDTDPLSIRDRRLILGDGIPSSPVAIFTPDSIRLVIGTSSGGKTIDPGITLPRQRTYWFEQRDN